MPKKTASLLVLAMFVCFSMSIMAAETTAPKKPRCPRNGNGQNQENRPEIMAGVEKKSRKK